jgi:hypothetical protein
LWILNHFMEDAAGCVRGDAAGRVHFRESGPVSEAPFGTVRSSSAGAACVQHRAELTEEQEKRRSRPPGGAIFSLKPVPPWPILTRRWLEDDEPQHTRRRVASRLDRAATAC